MHKKNYIIIRVNLVAPAPQSILQNRIQLLEAALAGESSGSDDTLVTHCPSPPILPLAKLCIKRAVPVPLPTPQAPPPSTKITTNKKGETELHLAAQQNDTQTLHRLLDPLTEKQRTALLKKETVDRNTPLDYAVRNAQDDACALLLKYNAPLGHNPKPCDFDYRAARRRQLQ